MDSPLTSRRAFIRRGSLVVPATVAIVGGAVEDVVRAVNPLLQRRTQAPRPRQAVGGAWDYYATAFDGLSYATHTGDLTSVSDSKVGIFSAWFKTSSASEMRFLYNPGGYFDAYISSTGAVFFVGYAVSAILNIHSGAGLADGNWHHVVASWDLNNGASGGLYIDGSSSYFQTTFTNNTIDYSRSGNWTVGGVGNTTYRLIGSLSEVYFNSASYVAASTLVSAFRNGTKPKDIGSDGSTPTGSQPIVYLHTGKGATFGNSSGYGGNFDSYTGTLTEDASKPA